MPFLPVFLWTDILIYLLLAVVIASVLYIRQKPHLRTPWRQVFQRKRGVISVMILLCYVCIGLLDSVHFRLALDSTKSSEIEQQHYSSEVITLLDLFVTPIRQQIEKSYSAPFATRSFSREMQTSEMGVVSYAYSSLVFAGAHLSEGQKKSNDIMHSVIKSTLWAIISCLVMVIAIMVYRLRKNKLSLRSQLNNFRSGQSSYPLLTILLMSLVLLIIAFNLATLSLSYHIFGTDKVGQDVFYQTLKSVRNLKTRPDKPHPPN